MKLILKKEEGSRLSLLQKLFIACLYIFLFQNVIQEVLFPFQYFDELFSIGIFVALFVYFLATKGKITVEKSDIYILILLAIIICTGLYSNFRYRYQPFKAVFQDVLLVCKFYLSYFLSKALFKSSADDIRFKSIVHIHCKGITLFLFALTVLDYAFHIFRTKVKYGIRSLFLFYSHPTFVAGVCVCLLALLIYTETKKRKITYVYMAMLLIMIVLTLRAKAFAMAAVAVVCYLYTIVFKKKITVSFWAIVGVLAFMLAFNKIQYYFFEINESARQQLLEKAFYIARDYFPFGTGFGTYASHPSKEVYSPIYYMYWLDRVWGLSETYNFFISDSFWPMILGQFGYTGLVAYVIILIIFFRKIQKTYDKDNIQKYCAAMLLFCYMLIASTSESAFVHTYSVMFAFLFGILM